MANDQVIPVRVDGRRVKVPVGQLLAPFEPLSLEEVAKELKLSDRHVRYLCEHGRFGRKMGEKHWVVFRWEVDAYKLLPRERPGPKPKEKEEE